jgi:hypothetical protein
LLLLNFIDVCLQKKLGSSEAIEESVSKKAKAWRPASHVQVRLLHPNVFFDIIIFHLFQAELIFCCATGNEYLIIGCKMTEICFSAEHVSHFIGFEKFNFSLLSEVSILLEGALLIVSELVIPLQLELRDEHVSVLLIRLQKLSTNDIDFPVGGHSRDAFAQE